MNKLLKAGLANKTGLFIGLAGALVVGVLMTASILRSTSSTAAIGFIFLPIICGLAFVVFFLWGSGVGYIWNWLVTRPRTFGVKIVLVLILTIGSAVFGIQKVREGLLVTDEVALIVKVQDGNELNRIFRQSPFNRNKFVLGAIAQNPAASAQLLDEMARLPDRELHDKMGSIFPVLGKNKKGLAVMRLIIFNPNVLPQTIEYLATSSASEYVLGDIAGSPKVSSETLSKLEVKKNYLIDWGLARNRRTTHDIFEKLLNRKRDPTHRTTLRIMIRNPKLPEEMRRRARALLKTY